MQGHFYESGSCVPKSCAILGVHPTNLGTTWEQNPRLRCHIWVRTPTKAIESSSIWRKRVGVDPTIRPAKDRITGFEGRESHRTLFASGNSIAWEWWLMTGDWLERRDPFMMEYTLVT